MLGQAMAIIFEPDLWLSMVNSFQGAVNTMGAFMLDALSSPIKYIQDKIQAMFETIELWAIKFRGGIAAIMGDDKEWERINAKQKDFEKGFAQEKKAPASIGGITAEDMRKNASDAMDRAAKNIMSIQDKGIISIAMIRKSFMDAFSGPGLFQVNFDEVSAKLEAIFAKLKKNIKPLELKPDARPGGGPAATETKFTTINTRFDELRRIGGGAGAAASDVPKRQLSVLEQIRDTLKGKNGGKLSPDSQLTGGAVFSFNHA
jgi:hypothetical protein